MKIRSGFVSNSSSSSFLLIGGSYPEGAFTEDHFIAVVGGENLPYPPDALYGENVHKLVFADHEEFGAPKGKLLIGVRYDLGDVERTQYTPLDDISATLQKVAELFPGATKMGLFTGKMMT